MKVNVIIRNSYGIKEIINVPYVKPSDLPAPENRKITKVENDLLSQSINNLSYIARSLNYV